MSGLLLFSAICFAWFFVFIIGFAVVISVVETVTGTTIGQWPEKISAFFEKGA